MPVNRKLYSDNVERARKFRQTMSESEKILWQTLRNSALGFKFRRQYPVGCYTLDFYCAEAMLCIEVDGDLHAEREKQDQFRDQWLLQKGIETIRIPTSDLYERLSSVKQMIWEMCMKRIGQMTD